MDISGPCVASRFLFGVHVYRFPSLPLPDLKRDLRILRNLGFNAIKVQESWSADERRPGEYDFGDVEELVAEARSLGLGVYLGVTMEQAPAWLWRRYPDAFMVNGLGLRHVDPTQYLLPSDGKPGPCWHHPGARDAAERFLTALAERLARFDNIAAWNVWQEFGFWPARPGAKELSETTYCYCPHSLAHFRRWLEEKYGTLEALNQTWRTAFGEWDEVEPPRMHMAVPSYIDWRAFMEDSYLADVVRWKARTLRAHDPLHRPSMCHVGSPYLGSAIEWPVARAVDQYGTSNYPGWVGFGAWEHGAPDRGGPVEETAWRRHSMWDNSLRFDYARGAAGDRHFWAAEFGGGPIVSKLFKGQDPTPADLQRWLLLALGCGVQAISFWNHRPEILWPEGHGFGLCAPDGTPTERAIAAGRIGMALQEHAQLFATGRPPQAPVAILIDEDLYHFAQASDGQQHLAHTIRGWYQALFESGIWVDFVDVRDLQAGGLHGYHAAILPFPLALADAVVDQLASWVADGGVLVSEACPGRWNEFGMANLSGLAASAEDLFGVTHANLRLVEEPGPPHWNLPGIRVGDKVPPTRLVGTGLLAGMAPQANVYLETFAARAAEPILLHGDEVAGVAHPQGKGVAYLIGTFMGHGIATYDDRETAETMRSILRTAGVVPEKVGRLLRRRRVGPTSEAWFLTNPTSATVCEEIEGYEVSRVHDLLDPDSPPVREGRFVVRVEPYDVRCLVLASAT